MTTHPDHIDQTIDPAVRRATDAAYDFMNALNDHISARIRYDRDGGRYRGDNPPNDDDIQTAFVNAVAAVAQTLRVTFSA
jgi:hypothetical protein